MALNKKAALQMSFPWLFAIIVGAIILFLAIFFSGKLIKTEQITQDVKTGKNIEVLLNPLETSITSATGTWLSMPVETRIKNNCRNDGIFGSQVIQTSQKSFNKWTETNLNIIFENKYLFSESTIEGKNFLLFSKPFEFPFKVTDLIYLIPESKIYCFDNAPEEIREELSNLKQKNLLYEDCLNNDNVITVCFSGSGCDIAVNQNMGYVEKKNERMYFQEDALMYAGIFSDKELYECEVKRIMQRLSQLALLYNNKASFISNTAGCNTNLNLIGLSNLANEGDSTNLFSMSSLVEDIDEKNKDNVDCRLW